MFWLDGFQLNGLISLFLKMKPREISREPTIKKQIDVLQASSMVCCFLMWS